MEVKSGNIEMDRGRQEEAEYVRCSVYLHYLSDDLRLLALLVHKYKY